MKKNDIHCKKHEPQSWFRATTFWIGPACGRRAITASKAAPRQLNPVLDRPVALFRRWSSTSSITTSTGHVRPGSPRVGRCRPDSDRAGIGFQDCACKSAWLPDPVLRGRFRCPVLPATGPKAAILKPAFPAAGDRVVARKTPIGCPAATALRCPEPPKCVRPPRLPSPTWTRFPSRTLLRGLRCKVPLFRCRPDPPGSLPFDGARRF